MNILLDTHIFLWAFLSPEKLPRHMAKLLESAGPTIRISQVSIWEMQIKYDLGKLPLRVSPREFIKAASGKFSFIQAPIQNEAIYLLTKLPHIHRDPFDRLLVAHALLNGWHIATTDPQLAKYPVQVIE